MVSGNRDLNAIVYIPLYTIMHTYTKKKNTQQIFTQMHNSKFKRPYSIEEQFWMPDCTSNISIPIGSKSIGSKKRI